jgi:hypothetical protein
MQPSAAVSTMEQVDVRAPSAGPLKIDVVTEYHAFLKLESSFRSPGMNGSAPTGTASAMGRASISSWCMTAAVRWRSLR